MLFVVNEQLQYGVNIDKVDDASWQKQLLVLTNQKSKN